MKKPLTEEEEALRARMGKHADELAKDIATAIKRRYMASEEIGWIYDIIRDKAFYFFMKSYYEEET